MAQHSHETSKMAKVLEKRLKKLISNCSVNLQIQIQLLPEYHVNVPHKTNNTWVKDERHG